MDIYGLDGVTAPDVNGVQPVSETDKILKIPIIAGTPATRAIEGVGRASDGAEGDAPVPDDYIARWIACMQSKTARSKANLRFAARKCPKMKKQFIMIFT